MASKAEVEQFLRTLKDKMYGFEVAFKPREKNTDTLAELDILPMDRLEYLKKLTVENYYKGPSKDTYDTTKPDYYEFGLQIKGREVYVKISLGKENKMIDCMSFHIAEHSIVYPYKTERKDEK